MIAGTYNGRALSAEWIKSSKNGTEGVRVTLKIRVSPEPDGFEQHVWTGWLTPNTIARVIEALRLMGARLANDDITDLEGLGSKTVQVVAEAEVDEHGATGEVKIAWINDPEGGPKPIDRAGLIVLAQKWHRKSPLRAWRPAHRAPRPTAPQSPRRSPTSTTRAPPSPTTPFRSEPRHPWRRAP